MTINNLRDRTSVLKKEKQSFINDTYMWVELARNAISELPDTKFSFQTPKAKKPQELRTVSRSHPENVKERIVNKDIFNSAFVSIVASVEDYLSKIMAWILKTDSKRLKCTIKDVKMVDTVSVIDLVDNDIETIFDNIIDLRLASLFYASPQKQLEYLDKALGIKIDDTIWKKWIEIKARRDLWIHNAGIVNQIYLDKSKDAALCSIGQEATITLQYFQETVALTKRMIGCIDREIRNVFPEQST
jgi:hypothetical protein